MRSAMESCLGEARLARGPGPASGTLCSVCEGSITEDQLEYELGFARDGDHPGLD
jgi:hypothetical protein